MNEFQKLRSRCLQIEPKEAEELVQFLRMSIPGMFRAQLSEEDRKRLSGQYDVWKQQSDNSLLSVLEKVTDLGSFLDFLRALADDWDLDRERAIGNPFAPYVCTRTVIT